MPAKTKRTVKVKRTVKPVVEKGLLKDDGILDERTDIETYTKPELSQDEVEKNVAEIAAFLEQDDAGDGVTKIIENVYVEKEPELTPEDTVAILEAKVKALEEAIIRGQKPYTKAAEGATVCPSCGSFTDWKQNPLTYGCRNCGASFHPVKPSG